MHKAISFVAAGLLSLSAACSQVRHTYRAQGYDPLSRGAIKRLAVVGWAPTEAAGAGPVAAQVAADLIKLRKNYLVTQASAGYAGRWSMACTNGVQGVVMVRVLRASEPKPGHVALNLAVSLLRCSDGALLYRSEVGGQSKSGEASLAQLVTSYEAAFGAEARTYAAPSFTLLQQVVAQLPDPVLDDKEVEEKIELGRAPRLAPAHAAG